MKNASVCTSYQKLAQSVHNQDALLLRIFSDPCKRRTFDRETLKLCRLNFAKHLARCRLLKIFGLTDLYESECVHVKAAQRVLRMCRARHPELIERVHQESFIGQLEVIKTPHTVSQEV